MGRPWTLVEDVLDEFLDSFIATLDFSFDLFSIRFPEHMKIPGDAANAHLVIIGIAYPASHAMRLSL